MGEAQWTETLSLKLSSSLGQATWVLGLNESSLSEVTCAAQEFTYTNLI